MQTHFEIHNLSNCNYRLHDSTWNNVNSQPRTQTPDDSSMFEKMDQLLVLENYYQENFSGMTPDTIESIGLQRKELFYSISDNLRKSILRQAHPLRLLSLSILSWTWPRSVAL